NRTSDLHSWDKEALDKLLRDVNTANDERLDQMLSDLEEQKKLYPADEPTPEGEAETTAEEPAAETPAETSCLKCPSCGHEFPARFVPAPAPEAAAEAA